MAAPVGLFPDGGLRDSSNAQLPQTAPQGKTVANPTHVVTLTLSSGEQVLTGSVAELLG